MTALDQSTLMFESLLLMGGGINLALSLLFFYLRTRAEGETLTVSQRWGLTILAWLFLLNSLHIFVQAFNFIKGTELDMRMMYLSSRIIYDIDIPIGFLLLIFGLVFPRPYMKWKRLRRAIVALLFICLTVMATQMYLNRTGAIPVEMRSALPSIVYTAGYFVPIFRWLPEYEGSTSDQKRITSTLLIWGFLVVPYYDIIADVFSIQRGYGDLGWYSIITDFLVLIVAFRILRGCYAHRSRWGRAEWIHIAIFLSFLILISIERTLTPVEQQISERPMILIFMTFMTANGSWMLLRPALFSYALLRFQLFGTRVRAERGFIYVLTLFLYLLLFISFVVVLSATEPWVLVGIGVLMAVVAIYPLLKVSERAVLRLLPMSAGQKRATMMEKRNTYLMSLQTAVINGQIDLARDEETLEELRDTLGISQREHDLLMNSYSLREAPLFSEGGIREVFLILTDGRLVKHASRSEEGGEKDVVAGMLMAIRGFVEEGFESRGQELDSISYGEYSLAIETRGNLVLAAVIEGEDDPDIHQRLHDALVMVEEIAGEDLEEWDGVQGGFPEIERMLRELVGVETTDKNRRKG